LQLLSELNECSHDETEILSPEMIMEQGIHFVVVEKAKPLLPPTPYEHILQYWIDEKKNHVRSSTRKNYEYTIKNWLIPHFVGRNVGDITRREIQDYFYMLSETYKRRTMTNISKVISQSFKWATENNYIRESPWPGVKIPRDKAIKEIEIFEPDEIDLLLKTPVLQYRKDMILLAFRTGLRIGEILALKWDDINISKEFLMVRRTLSGYENGEPVIDEPKTASSRRRVDFDKVTKQMLERRMKENTYGHEYVFCKMNGRPYSRQCIHIDKICKEAGINPRSFHALRHTHASLLLASGIHPKIVQERLGHANINMTLDTYSHLVPGMQKEAVKVFNEMRESRVRKMFHSLLKKIYYK
jgi:integrase